jgi:hypothetical protein
MAAVDPTAAHPRVAVLGVIFGGIMAMAGRALNFARRRRRHQLYFQETKRMGEGEGAPGACRAPKPSPTF